MRWSPRPVVRWLVLIGSVLLLASCGDPNEPVVGEPTPEPMQTPIDERCEDADAPLVALVSAQLEPSLTLDHVQVVASSEIDDLRFLAAELVRGDGDRDPPIGTWALLGDDDDAEVFAVNAVARSESSAEDGTKSRHALTMKTDGGEEAETCVEAAAP